MLEFLPDLPWVPLALLALGVVGSLLPLVPGPLFSLAGVGYHWWQTGEPGPLLLATLVVLGLVALAVDYLGGAVAARAGGASLRTTVAATVAGVVLALVVGPLGLVLGVGGTVLALEVRRHRDLDAGLRTALVTVVGALAAGLVQALLTGTMLVAFLLVVL
jgi:hypothetical protein